jgi:nucleoside-diphosphate-sugar epimerase
MANVLVTGGAGFIGSHLAEALLGDDPVGTIMNNIGGTEAVLKAQGGPAAEGRRGVHVRGVWEERRDPVPRRR